jgi:hypothetical protein
LRLSAVLLHGLAGKVGMERDGMRALRHWALLLGLFWVSSLAMAALSEPPEWNTSRGGHTACIACHDAGIGFSPIEATGPSTDLRAAIQSPSAFLTYVSDTNGVGANSSAMSGIDPADAEVIRKYLLQRLYGEISAPALNSSTPPSYTKALGSVAVGSSNTTTFTLSNARTTVDPITYSVSSSNAQFTVDNETCAGVGRSMAPGDLCSMDVHFVPSSAGAKSATLTLTVDGLPQTVNLSGTGLAPAYSVNNSSLSITATVGSSNSAQATLTNSGSAALVLGTLTLGGASPAEYALTGSTCTDGLSIAAGASCVVQVTFAPASATAPGSPRLANVSITHNASGSPNAISLSGTATAAAAPSILADKASLSFGNTQSGSSQQQTVTVTNNGTASLNFSSLAVSGSHAADFTRGGTCALGTSLSQGATCTVTITFAPGALNARSATLAIDSDASNGNLTLPLSGTGIPVPVPAVGWSTTALAFGNQTIAGLYGSRQLTLTNTGSATLNITSLGVPTGPFSVLGSSTCSASLAAGASCTVDIKFNPSAVGSASATLTLASNAAGAPHTVALSGQGTSSSAPVLVWSPLVSTVDFGNVAVGSASATQTVTVSNQGPGGASITLINVVGVDASQFSITPVNCAANGILLEGDTCDLTVQFNPGLPGVRTAQVQFASSGSPPTTLTLTGVGLGGPTPMVTVSGDTFDFGGVRVGASSTPQDVVISSSGSGPLQVTGMSVTGPFVLSSKTCPAVPFTLPSGSTCVMTVSLKPESVGASVGTLSLSSNAANTATVSLSGQGQAAPETSGGGCSIATQPSAFDPTLWLLGAAAAGVLWKRRRQAQRRRP